MSNKSTAVEGVSMSRTNLLARYLQMNKTNSKLSVPAAVGLKLASSSWKRRYKYQEGKIVWRLYISIFSFDDIMSSEG